MVVQRVRVGQLQVGPRVQVVGLELVVAVEVIVVVLLVFVEQLRGQVERRVLEVVPLVVVVVVQLVRLVRVVQRVRVEQRRVQVEQRVLVEAVVVVVPKVQVVQQGPGGVGGLAVPVSSCRRVPFCRGRRSVVAGGVQLVQVGQRVLVAVVVQRVQV